jgi:predicted nucleic acid-binding protein
MLYLDTSAFLKLLVEEEHSKKLRRALSSKELWSSTLLSVEAHRAGIRLGVTPTDVDLRLVAVTMVVPSETTFETARSIGPNTLRTLDALHLAAALELGEDLDGVVTYDRRLASGCAQLDVPVVAPGRGRDWWTD